MIRIYLLPIDMLSRRLGERNRLRLLATRAIDQWEHCAPYKADRLGAAHDDREAIAAAREAVGRFDEPAAEGGGG